MLYLITKALISGVIHDLDRFHHRHQVFRNGVWVWIYGPDYCTYNDCRRLRRQALITGESVLVEAL
jgi:hypothetical protein